MYFSNAYIRIDNKKLELERIKSDRNSEIESTLIGDLFTGLLQPSISGLEFKLGILFHDRVSIIFYKAAESLIFVQSCSRH
ncbi:MAG: hypothetical protein CMO12_02975 [Thaumarchaeota archaeon]|nr:hypothetical protein [Nitrososphaerota archaeon]